MEIKRNSRKGIKQKTGTNKKILTTNEVYDERNPPKVSTLICKIRNISYKQLNYARSFSNSLDFETYEYKLNSVYGCEDCKFFQERNHYCPYLKQKVGMRAICTHFYPRSTSKASPKPRKPRALAKINGKKRK